MVPLMSCDGLMTSRVQPAFCPNVSWDWLQPPPATLKGVDNGWTDGRVLRTVLVLSIPSGQQL